MEKDTLPYLYLAVIISIVVITQSARAAPCPDKCQCSWGHPSTSLTVYCQHGRSDIDRHQLTEQLDSLLSSNLTYGRLTSLKIVNSPLTHVPRSVCRLTTLTHLSLDYNQLTRLPDNCFTNLTALTQLSAYRNNVSELQDGLFDGLQHLQILNLARNEIASIELEVFNSSAMLTSLREVRLDANRLTALEPWFYFIGINGNVDFHAVVDLSDNKIERFTNVMGLKLNCGMAKMNTLDLHLGANNFSHISDMMRGWNITARTLLCMFSSTYGNHGHITLTYDYFQCDCVDYDIYKLVAMFPTCDLLINTFCSMPDNLYHKKVCSIPLIEFVCKLSDRCPPGCRCIHRPANATLHVDCSNSNLTALPLELPALPKSYTKYKLDFSNNQLLRRLGHRDYFVNTSILDASHSQIEAVGNWEDLFTVKEVYLDGNRITSLPVSVTTMNVSTQKLSLHDNPWRCGCNDTWIFSWLNKNVHRLLNASDILCSYPETMVSRSLLRNANEFCSQPKSTPRTNPLTIGSLALTAVVVALVCVSVIVYRLRHSLYKRLYALNLRGLLHRNDDNNDGKDRRVAGI